jgi:hypothetical protein
VANRSALQGSKGARLACVGMPAARILRMASSRALIGALAGSNTRRTDSSSVVTDMHADKTTRFGQDATDLNLNQHGYG